MTGFIFVIVNTLLQFLVFAIIASAILSWLVAFNVINIQHPVARQIVYFLEAVTRPVLWPFRRFIPPLGGVDITPLLALVVIEAFRSRLLPWLLTPLQALIG